MQHSSNDQPLQLVLPVFTSPQTVQQAVAGMLCGQLSLSASNVEAVLVLANAVGVSDASVHTLHPATVSWVAALSSSIRDGIYLCCCQC